MSDTLKPCWCGEPEKAGIVHRNTGACYIPVPVKLREVCPACGNRRTSPEVDRLVGDVKALEELALKILMLPSVSQSTAVLLGVDQLYKGLKSALQSYKEAQR